MIAFAKDFWPNKKAKRDKKIPLRMPRSTLIFTGAKRESINAVLGPDDRIKHMVIHTKHPQSYGMLPG